MGQLHNMAGINYEGAQRGMELLGMALEGDDEAAAIVYSEKITAQMAQIRKWAGNLYTSPYSEFEEIEEE